MRTICSGDSVTVGNRVFKISGFYSVTLTRPNTCDSTVDLTLTVLPKVTNAISRTICSSDSVTVGNRVFKISGFYSVTLTRPNTCDSTVDLTLTVLPKVTNAISRTICSSDSVTVGNRVFKISGFYSVTLTRPNTCDSTVDLTLTVLPKVTNAISRTICS